jgi:glycosyltransferase involved in cell wall biosynthesis
VAPERPYPAIGGGAIRTASLLEFLAQRFRLDVIGFREQGAPGLEFPDGLVNRAVTIHLPFHPRNGAARAARNLRRWARGVPPLLDRFAGYSNQVAEAVSGRRYALALVEHFWCAPYLPLLRSHAARAVLDLHNVESELQASLALASFWPARQAYQRFRRAYEEAESYWLPQFDLVLVTSEEDRERAARIAPGARLAVYPNAIRPRELPPAAEERCIAFSGNMAYAPNVSAVAHFAKRIWPRIRAAAPDLEWRLVGMHPEAVAKLVAGKAGVRLTGPVEDAVAELARAQACVVPLRSGSGTRFKILEAWAAGRAVVSTPLGAEGLGARDGEHLLIAKSDADFALAVLRVINDTRLRQSLGEAGKALLESRFTWRSAWEQIRSLPVLAPGAP